MPELKDGRLPRGFSSRLAFWKAEELHKFAFPASELIFADLLESQDYHIWELVVRMCELVFNKRDGWSHEDVHLFEKLDIRYTILIEEKTSLTSCGDFQLIISISLNTKVYYKRDFIWVPQL